MIEELFPKLYPSVPIVEAIGNDANGNATGSGFLIEHMGRPFVVTNLHVIEGACNIAIHFLDEAGSVTGSISPGQTDVAAIHQAADLVLIDVTKAISQIWKRQLAPLILADRTTRLAPGRSVFAIGHPGVGSGFLTHTVTNGIVSGLRQFENGVTCVQVTVPINPGNSGGPLFDDEGKVVGVNTFKISEREALNFAVCVDHVYDLVAAVRNPSKTVPKAVPKPSPAKVGKTGKGADEYANPKVKLVLKKPEMGISCLGLILAIVFAIIGVSILGSSGSWWGWLFLALSAGAAVTGYWRKFRCHSCGKELRAFFIAESKTCGKCDQIHEITWEP